MPNSLFRAHPHFPSLISGVLAAVAGLSGCLPSTSGPLGPAPLVDTAAEDAETAYWRREYRKNRTLPPKEYAVPPGKPRNNEFGEFDDAMYASLDAQPALPSLPGERDVMAMHGVPADFSPAAAPSRYSQVNGLTTAATRHMPTATDAAALPAPAGLDSGGHFYPIEQLVYGGDYAGPDAPEQYRLMPKDAISVTVKDHPEFSATLDIEADGSVRIPNTPEFITLRGQTVDAAAETIRNTLQIYVKNDCVVRVQVNRARGGYYFVFGDVSHPGRFPMGLEPIQLSDAILAANWEANPNRMPEGDELGPAFPAAGPRGAFNAPASADLARVMLITPHRSQPVRTLHDVRGAILGMTSNDIVVRPGQIIVVPSLDPARNVSIGLDVPEAFPPLEAVVAEQGFATAAAGQRLPEIHPASHPSRQEATWPVSRVETNMVQAFQVQANTPPAEPIEEYYDADSGYYLGAPSDIALVEETATAEAVIPPKAEPQPAPTPATTPTPAPAKPEATAPSQKQSEVNGLNTSGPPQRLRGRRLPRPSGKQVNRGAEAKRNKPGSWSKGL